MPHTTPPTGGWICHTLHSHQKMGVSAAYYTINRWVGLPHHAQSPSGGCVCRIKHSHQQVGMMHTHYVTNRWMCLPNTTPPTGGSDATHYTTNRWVCLPQTTSPTGGSVCRTLHHQQVGVMHTTSPTGWWICHTLHSGSAAAGGSLSNDTISTRAHDTMGNKTHLR